MVISFVSGMERSMANVAHRIQLCILTDTVKLLSALTIVEKWKVSDEDKNCCHIKFRKFCAEQRLYLV